MSAQRRERGVSALVAEARFEAGERLLNEGRTTEGPAELARHSRYRSVGATFYLERAEALVAQCRRDSA